ncbi:acyl-CoA dehydrogenase family protein [Amycolatopsis sp. GM8]|uniref:acyl-CoA dehydrogenase family protein n=1 Tax=Amycolatopsis sp. GM8 TaxID=2896530 RepID=UPI001F4075F7|nr:acyl-CoA dehydrogenase family protein [Amycolatopsis sp. GM8]
MNGVDTEALAKLRGEVRAFLAEQLAAGTFEPGVDSWLAGFSREFTRELGRRGWIGMVWPTEYGGHGRTARERFTVMEELLAAGAPVSAYWGGDRQVGPSLLRHGSEEQKRRFLPAMAAGETLFCLGLSEPDSGSDLASVRTTATKQPDGSWVVSGSKLWTSGAHHKDYMLTLCRSLPGATRHDGLSQLIIDLRAPGVTVRPVLLLSGEHHFNEVFLDEVPVPADMLLGTENGAWAQVSTELADERSGPERYMSTMMLIRAYAEEPVEHTRNRDETIGSLVSQLWSVRALSLQVVEHVARGETPSVLAATSKDVGTTFEQDSIDIVRRGLARPPEPGSRLDVLLRQGITHSPGFTLRGGTTQVLRSVIAKRLGL